MKATGATTADECRSIGLQVGQTIEGTDELGETARLTLQWIGDEVAVFRVTELRLGATEWTRPKQSADWTLRYRDWILLAPCGRFAAGDCGRSYWKCEHGSACHVQVVPVPKMTAEGAALCKILAAHAERQFRAHTHTCGPTPKQHEGGAA